VFVSLVADEALKGKLAALTAYGGPWPPRRPPTRRLQAAKAMPSRQSPRIWS